jgi:hypothetical protein
MPIQRADTLAAVPSGLRDPLFSAFDEIVRNYRERRWEPAELNGGKLSEVIYNILKGVVDGRFPTRPKKPANMLDACKALEQADGNQFSRSIRIQVPRVLIALYEVRNNRGVGHIGGDVDPNHMDATFVLHASKWLMAELVRIFHNTDIATASATVDALVERESPLVWEVAGKRRVLAGGLSMKEKMLLLLYTSPTPVAEKDICEWIEHSNPTTFRRDVIVPAHDSRLIEYDRTTRLLHLSELGSSFVEGRLPQYLASVGRAA